MKNRRIHEPPNGIEPCKFYLAFSKKSLLKRFIEIKLPISF
jgi:hypothetical protein